MKGVVVAAAFRRVRNWFHIGAYATGAVTVLKVIYYISRNPCTCTTFLMACLIVASASLASSSVG